MLPRPAGRLPPGRLARFLLCLRGRARLLCLFFVDTLLVSLFLSPFMALAYLLPRPNYRSPVWFVRSNPIVSEVPTELSSSLEQSDGACVAPKLESKMSTMLCHALETSLETLLANEHAVDSLRGFSVFVWTGSVCALERPQHFMPALTVNGTRVPIDSSPRKCVLLTNRNGEALTHFPIDAGENHKQQGGQMRLALFASASTSVSQPCPAAIAWFIIGRIIAQKAWSMPQAKRGKKETPLAKKTEGNVGEHSLTVPTSLA